MASDLSIIIDDNSGRFTYGGGTWAASTLVVWYGGTSSYPAFVSSATGTFGSFSLAFHGTSIAFIGNTPGFQRSEVATITIDGNAPYNISYRGTPSETPQIYGQWYRSPTLPDGNHTISVDHLDLTSIDFAVVSVGPTTPLIDENIVVDNDDASIEYTGKWARNTDGFNAGILPSGFPYGNSTHRSSTVGDTFHFRFSGTSAHIYGILNFRMLGTLSATYTLDGASLTQSYLVSSNSPEHNNNAGEEQNRLLFSYDSLSPGEHTLIVNITASVNQTFIFDYLTYKPSFSTLATKPNLTLPDAGNSTATSKVPVGAIVGGAIGGAAVLCVIILALVWFWKRRSRRQSSVVIEAENETVYPLPSFNLLPNWVASSFQPEYARNAAYYSSVNPKRERQTPTNSLLPEQNWGSNKQPHASTAAVTGSSAIPLAVRGGILSPMESSPPAYDDGIHRS